MIRDIQALAELTTADAVDSGNTAAPMPLATAAVKVASESISPMIFALRRRKENASSTRLRIAEKSQGKKKLSGSHIT